MIHHDGNSRPWATVTFRVARREGWALGFAAAPGERVSGMLRVGEAVPDWHVVLLLLARLIGGLGVRLT